MSDMQRLEPCEVCGAIATDQVITDRGMRYFCLIHLPENVRLATDAEATAANTRTLDHLRAALAAATARAEAAEEKLAAATADVRTLCDLLREVRYTTTVQEMQRFNRVRREMEARHGISEVKP